MPWARLCHPGDGGWYQRAFWDGAGRLYGSHVTRFRYASAILSFRLLIADSE